MKILGVAIFASFFAGLAIAGGTGPMSVPAGAQSALNGRPFAETLQNLNNSERLFLAACCKTCRKGKACGDSCISRKKTCRKGAGCACDG